MLLKSVLFFIINITTLTQSLFFTGDRVARSIMDLNVPPPEFNYDFLDAMFQGPKDACEPIFCTQQLPNKQDVPTVSEIRL